MMNVNATHDSPRLLSDFENKGKYKYHANPYEDTAYITGKPSAETYARVKLYLLHQYTSIGSPHIWNGDEFGMWGGDDPDERKPLWWEEFTFDPETRTNVKPGKKIYDNVGFNREMFNYYKKLITIRKENPVLSNGKFDFIKAEGNTLIYKRENKNEIIYTLFNLDKKRTIPYSLGKGKFIDLITGREYDGANIKIEPFSGLVLKKR